MKTEDRQPSSRPFRVHRAQDLGAAVKHFRTRAGVTQVELAARAGIHRSYLSDLENGHHTEALERLMSLFRELGVRITITPEEW